MCAKLVRKKYLYKREKTCKYDKRNCQNIIAAVANYHKLGYLKKHKPTPIQFQISEVNMDLSELRDNYQTGIPGGENKDRKEIFH